MVTPAINEPVAIINATIVKGKLAANKKPGSIGPNTAPPRPIPSTKPDPEPNSEDGNDEANKPKKPEIAAKINAPVIKPITFIDSNVSVKYGNKATPIAAVIKQKIINIFIGAKRATTLIPTEPSTPPRLITPKTLVAFEALCPRPETMVGSHLTK